MPGLPFAYSSHQALYSQIEGGCVVNSKLEGGGVGQPGQSPVDERILVRMSVDESSLWLEQKGAGRQVTAGRSRQAMSENHPGEG